MDKLKIMDIISLILVIIGGLNWLLIGVFKYDLVKAIFGDMSDVSRIIYIIVGLASIYLILITPRLARK